MKKQLSEDQFRAAVKGLDIGPQTIEIAHGVLVQGRSQISFAQALGLSRGAISQAVNRVWAVHAARNLPAGYAKVTAVLPEHQAYVVKKWNDEAKKKLGPKSK